MPQYGSTVLPNPYGSAEPHVPKVGAGANGGAWQPYTFPYHGMPSRNSLREIKPHGMVNPVATACDVEQRGVWSSLGRSHALYTMALAVHLVAHHHDSVAHIGELPQLEALQQLRLDTGAVGESLQQ